MRGELFIRTKATRALSVGAGVITTRPSDWPSTSYSGDGWVDAYMRYGLSLEDGARSKIMTPAPMKTPTNYSDANLNGVAYLGSTIGKFDKHEFSFDMNFVASSKEIFLQNYQLFCDEILECQYFQLRLDKQIGKVRHLLYNACEPFKEYCLECAQFTLSVIEPHPEITDEREPSIM